MRVALALAARGLGQVAPNPAVGCVIVSQGHVSGRGWTQPSGRPHAETEALSRAGEAANGATAYVSLEPCSHHGETPPCADALIAAGIKRAVVAAQDSDPRVSGNGIARLKEAGVQVEVGLFEAEARALNAGFFKRAEQGLPHVSLKLATTVDGQIATRTGNSQWITGVPARRHGHLLRATHDAILTGIGTVLADDPALTCRLDGMSERSPIRVVLDSGLRTPPGSKLMASAGEIPVWIVTGETADGKRADALRSVGAKIIEVPAGPDGRPDVTSAARALAERGITRILAECGPELAASLLKAGLVDQLEWFRAGKVVGGDGQSAVAGLGVDVLTETVMLRRIGLRPIGEDMLETYRVAPY